MRFAWFVMMFGVLAVDAQSQEATKRPSYSFLRYEEDWSALRGVDRDARSDYLDEIKYVPLSDDGSIWASFGGHVQIRAENWSNFGFGSAPGNNDDALLLGRLLGHADVHFGDKTRVFVEGKTAGSTDRDLPGGRRTLDVDTLALEQAFVDRDFDLGDGTLTMRLGRQVLSFGKQRLVSPLPWGNTLRRWDGVMAILRQGDWKVSAFWTQFAPTRKYEFNKADSDQQFWGVYATGPIEGKVLRADVYYLGLDRSIATTTFNGTTGSEVRHTIGTRLFGKPTDRLDYDVEVAHQFGEVGSGDVSAQMLGSEIGYNLAPEGSLKPRLFFGLDAASGDSSPGGRVGTFNQLFPLGHAHLAFIDIIGRQNVIDASFGASIVPASGVTLRAALHVFRRASDADALYDAGGGVVRSGAAGTSRDIGEELDLTAAVGVDKHTRLLFGYSHFFPGTFVSQSGASDDIDFAYAQVIYTF